MLLKNLAHHGRHLETVVYLTTQFGIAYPPPPPYKLYINS